MMYRKQEGGTRLLKKNEIAQLERRLAASIKSKAILIGKVRSNAVLTCRIAYLDHVRSVAIDVERATTENRSFLVAILLDFSLFRDA